jgi:hypothetical protein
VELEANPEHQQDHAELGELLGAARVSHEAGRVGSDKDAGQQVSDEWRQPQPVCGVPEQEGRRQASRQREEERDVQP